MEHRRGDPVRGELGGLGRIHRSRVDTKKGFRKARARRNNRQILGIRWESRDFVAGNRPEAWVFLSSTFQREKSV